MDAGFASRGGGSQHLYSQCPSGTEVIERVPGQAGPAWAANPRRPPLVPAGMDSKHGRRRRAADGQDGGETVLVDVIVIEPAQPAAAHARTRRQALLHLVEITAEQDRDHAGWVAQNGLHGTAEPGELAAAAHAQGKQKDVEFGLVQNELGRGIPRSNGSA